MGAYGETHDGSVQKGTDALIEGRKIIFNTTFRWSGEILTKVLWFVFVIILARRLGSSGFGYFNYAFSFGSMLIVFTDLGTNILIVKNVSKDTSLTGYYLTNVVFLKVILSIVVFIAIAVYANAHAQLPLVLVLISSSLLIGAFLDPLNSIFRAYGKMYYETVVMLFWRMMIVGASLFGLYRLNFGLLGISISFLLAGIVTLLMSFQIIKSAFHIETFSFKVINIHVWGRLLKESLPVGIWIIISTLFYKLNVVLLEYFSKSDEVGWYSASFKLIEVAFFVPSIFIASIFPYLCRDGERDRISDSAYALFKRAFLFLLGVALILATVMFLFSSAIISHLYGNNYFPAVRIMSITAWMPVFIYLNELFIILFLSIDKQKVLIALMSVPMIIYLISCFVLIPRLNGIGAAWSLLVTQIVFFIINISYFIHIRTAQD